MLARPIDAEPMTVAMLLAGTVKLDEIVRQTNPHTKEAVAAMLDGDAARAFAELDAGGGRVVEQPDRETRLAVIARDFARLTPAEREATLVPTRAARAGSSSATPSAPCCCGKDSSDPMP